MCFSETRGLTAGQWLSLLLTALLTTQCFAQRPSQPGEAAETADALVKAARQASRAQEELDCVHTQTTDPVAEALVYTGMALKTLRDARIADAVQRNQAVALRARLEEQERDLKRQQTKLSNTAESARKAMTAGRLVTAAKLLESAAAPKCDARFPGLSQQLQKLNEQVDGYVERGNGAVNSAPEKAIADYTEAMRINSEFPGIREKVAQAYVARADNAVTGSPRAAIRDYKEALRIVPGDDGIQRKLKSAEGMVRSTWSKILAGSLIVAVVGAAGFYTYKELDRRKVNR